MPRSEQVEQMAQRGSSLHNVVDFPRSNELRLEQAIQAFDAGDKSASLFQQFVDLVDKGFEEANYFLGCMYEDGTNGVTKNLNNALYYYEKSVEGFGYLEGYLAVARLLYHGTDVQHDYLRAFRYYQHVAQQRNHPVAFFMLGRMYQYGTGVSKDLKQARACYSKAIAAGSIYGMTNLAMLEAEEGHFVRSVLLRIRAGVCAFLIARRNPRDIRLRGG